MALQNLRGFRDYYPEDQAKIMYLRDKIADKCRRFGYEEFEGPTVESFELYAAKSSEEIVREQAFTFKDRGDENIALRPELTPTLARMVAAKQGELVFPVRWWSFGRFWRYERPQKGRSREFYQWNLDMLGDDSVESDVEILTILIRFMQSLGLSSQDVVFELSDRSFVTEYLAQQGVGADDVSRVFAYLDKLPKLNPEEAVAFAEKLELTTIARDTANQLASQTDLWKKSERLTAIMARLKDSDLTEWVTPNLTIVRGFTYYTGIVFEASDRDKQFRAILGGGRYSNLVSDVGGKPVSGIGMGMGDMVITDLLESKGLMPAYKIAPTVAVIVTNGPDTFVTQAARTLREANIATIVFYGEFGKGLKFASRKQADYAILVGPDEISKKMVSVKNLSTGDQQAVTLDKLTDQF